MAGQQSALTCWNGHPVVPRHGSSQTLIDRGSPPDRARNGHGVASGQERQCWNVEWLDGMEVAVIKGGDARRFEPLGEGDH